MSWLQLADDREVEREVRGARVETLLAALAATYELEEAELSGLMRHRYEVLLHRAELDLAQGGDKPAKEEGAPGFDDAAAIHRATAAERQRLLALRQSGTIGDVAFQRLEQELDLEELYLQQVTGERSAG